MRRWAMVAMLAALAGGAARANDTSAELAAGGLLFVQNDDIEMRSEDLFISPKEVRVRYRFFNKSAAPVTILVAFPLPEIRIDDTDDNISIPTQDPVNIFAFATTVNSQPVTTKVEQRAYAVGIERTQYLRDLGIPLAPHLEAAGQALDKLPKDKWAELVRLGLAEIEEFDVGKGNEQHLSPRWGLQTTFYWEQTFAPKVETVVEHHYKPSVGGSVGTSLGTDWGPKEAWYGDYLRKYCIDKDLLSTLANARKAAKADSPPYGEQRIEYILKTGANWSGAIKDFHLTVDKGDAASLVSFCGENVKKIGPTQFDMRKADFTPDGNFSVLILTKQPAQ